MLFSIYPTDTPEVRAAVLDQACAVAEAPMLFTSLHQPESDGLRGFGAELASAHRLRGATFCADISPLALERLGEGPAGLQLLGDWGVTMLRIDFGFTPEEIRRIARASGCRIAVNASTATAAFLEDLADIEVIGWHNFYPRPETGIGTDFFISQNTMFAERGRRVHAFLPGESALRAPLHLGLPTLEEQRHRTAWRNYLHLRAIAPDVEIVCAEGTVRAEHLEWIAHHERTGEVTVPLSDLDPAATFLRGAAWRLRIEDSAASFRLEGTRGSVAPDAARNADRRAAGSLQMDLDSLGRYRGEIHLMRRDLPLTGLQAHVGEIAAPARGIVESLRPGDTVRFV